MKAYDFKLVYRLVIANADALSRLSCTPLNASVPDPTGVFFLDYLPSPPLVASEVAQFITHPELSRVYSWVKGGWPQKSEAGFQAYSTKQHELSIHKQWGIQLVIPDKGQ